MGKIIVGQGRKRTVDLGVFTVQQKSVSDGNVQEAAETAENEASDDAGVKEATGEDGKLPASGKKGGRQGKSR